MLPEAFTPELLQRLELYKIRARRAFLGTRQGGHVSPKKGHGIEFSDYRQYELGDNPRHIDWGLYARSERLYIKRYQEEENLSVLIIVDGSPSMVAVQADRKWEMARDLAVALAYIGLMEQDTVAASVLGHFHSPSYSGARAIHILGDELLKRKPKAPTLQDLRNSITQPMPLARELQRALSRIRFPGVALFLSDFLMPFEENRQLFSLLAAKNLDTTAIQILGPGDLDPLQNSPQAVAIDSETGEEIQLDLDDSNRALYKIQLEDHNRKLHEYLVGSGVSHIRINSTDELGKVVLENLARTGLLR